MYAGSMLSEQVLFVSLHRAAMRVVPLDVSLSVRHARSPCILYELQPRLSDGTYCDTTVRVPLKSGNNPIMYYITPLYATIGELKVRLAADFDDPLITADCISLLVDGGKLTDDKATVHVCLGFQTTYLLVNVDTSTAIYCLFVAAFTSRPFAWPQQVWSESWSRT